MPAYNVANIVKISELMTDVAEALGNAGTEFIRSQSDWGLPLAPEDAEKWDFVFSGMASSLSTAATRVGLAALALKAVADRYGQAEATAEAALTDILNGIE
ncbi:hypothetical protein [Flindersiella endophytica]